MNEKTMKTGAIGIVIGAAATAALLLSTGFAVMKNDAERSSMKASQVALVDGYATICVAQFKGAVDRSNQLETVMGLEGYKRGEYVAQHKWATMPGSAAPFRNVADECAQRIAKLAE